LTKHQHGTLRHNHKQKEKQMKIHTYGITQKADEHTKQYKHLQNYTHVGLSVH